MKLLTKTQTEIVVEVKAGKYVLADMCHIVPTELWNPEWDDEINGPAPIMKIGEICCLMFGAKQGDGVYCSNYGSEVVVDSGSIGLININDIPAEWNVKTDDFSFIEFDDDCTCSNTGGVLDFDGEIIDTTEYDEDDDDDDDYDDGEDEF
jgi:hypothetical protein